MAEHPLDSSAGDFRPGALSPADFSSGNPSNEHLPDTAMTRALRHRPALVIPASFAARVATTAANQAASDRASAVARAASPATQKTRHYGRAAAIISMCVLLAMILMFAPRAASASRLWISAEEIFSLQFALLAVWLVVRDLRQYIPWTTPGDS